MCGRVIGGLPNCADKSNTNKALLDLKGKTDEVASRKKSQHLEDKGTGAKFSDSWKGSRQTG